MLIVIGQSIETGNIGGHIQSMQSDLKMNALLITKSDGIFKDVNITHLIIINATLVTVMPFKFLVTMGK